MNTRKNLVIASIITLLAIGFGSLVAANQQLVATADSGVSAQGMNSFFEQDSDASYEEYEDDDEYEEREDDDEYEERDDDDKYEDDDDD